MRVVIQRVSEASVSVGEKITGKIDLGLLILVGFEAGDNKVDIEWMCGKISRLRIFNDANNVMNLSVVDVNADILVVSQFTLHASTKKGNRPSYIKAAIPDIAIPLYNDFISVLKNNTGKEIQSGVFGAMMDVKLVNDGPVTIIIDSKNKE